MSKDQAKKIKEILTELGHEIPLGHCYELVAKMEGHASWNVMSALKEDKTKTLFLTLVSLNVNDLFEPWTDADGQAVSWRDKLGMIQVDTEVMRSDTGVVFSVPFQNDNDHVLEAYTVDLEQSFHDKRGDSIELSDVDGYSEIREIAQKAFDNYIEQKSKPVEVALPTSANQNKLKAKYQTLKTEEETYEIDNELDQPIKFAGKLLGSASSSSESAHPEYSGETGISNSLAVYITKSGRYVCKNRYRTQWQGSRNKTFACVADTEKEVIDFFAGQFGGLTWLVKDLFTDCEIDCSVIV